MQEIVLEAKAKVNFTLDVLGKLPNGYHRIRSVMQSIDLSDRLHLRRSKSDITIEIEQFGEDACEQVPNDSTNLAWRAAELFFREASVLGGVAIHVRKNIPVSAGLAGGSADAAGVLYGLNLLFDRGLSLPELQDMGVKLGADIPFCLQGGTMLAEGIGEELTALSAVPEWTLVLIKPDFSVSTKEVYEKLNSANYGDKYTAKFLRALEQSHKDLVHLMGNGLEIVTANLRDEIAVWKRRLLEDNAQGALMSGSGPTVYGVFTDTTQADGFMKKWGREATIRVTKPCQSGIVPREQMNGGGL